jgi:5-methylcytosine-specific restriction enzyme subunit McrC
VASSLTVFERDRLDIPPGAAGLRAKARLLGIAVGGKQAFTFRKGAVYATDFVGAVDLGDLKIEILPKPYGIKTAPDARHLLFNLLRWAGDDVRPTWLATGSSSRETNLLEIVERRAAAELLQRLEVGVPRRYQEMNERTSTLRGRIQLSDYSRQLPSDSHLLPVRYFPLVANNELGRLLRALATTLRNRATSYGARRDLDRCLDLLADVKTYPLTPELVRRVRLGRLEADWLGLVDLAGLLASDRSPDPATLGVTKQATLLFPMNRLFESAIRTILATHLSEPLSCLRSPGEHRLLSLTAQSASITALAVRPDLLFAWDGRVIAAGDAKWKSLTQTTSRYGILPSDVFQVLTYMRLFDARTGFLFFPRTEWMPSEWNCEFFVSPTQQERLIAVAVNLPDLVSSNGEVRRLEAIKLATQVLVAVQKAAPGLEQASHGPAKMVS